jgi:hypothetical protein
MPFNLELPDGRVITDIPDDVDKEALRAKLAKEFPEYKGTQKQKEAPAIAPQAEAGTGFGAFIPSVQRGYYQTESLLGDVLPAMAGRVGEKLGIKGAKEYADKQMQEAAEAQAEIQRKYPTAVGSFENIKGLGDFGTYVVEAVGELIPTAIPSIFTGGTASVVGRGAVVAAKKAAEEAVIKGAAKNLGQAEIAEMAKKAGIEAAKREALKYEAAGALAGSAAQNIPEVYQNIAETTGKENLGAALVAGGFNAVLDAITPLKLLRQAKGLDLSGNEIIGEWYKRVAKGLGTGFLTEGGTEALQEMSSAAAEKYVDEHKDFFTKDNFIRFIDAGLKGGLGGGVASGVGAGVFGRKEAPTIKEEPAEEAAKKEGATYMPSATTVEGAKPLTLDEALAEVRDAGLPKKEKTDESIRTDAGTGKPSVLAPREEDKLQGAGAGTTPADVGGLGGDKSSTATTAGGEREQQSTLDFNQWLGSKGISLTDIASDEEFANLEKEYQKEQGIAPTEVKEETKETVAKETTKKVTPTKVEEAEVKKEYTAEDLAKIEAEDAAEEEANAIRRVLEADEKKILARKAIIDAQNKFRAEIEKQNFTEEEVEQEVSANNYYVNSRGKEDQALRMLAGDLYVKSSANTDPDSPNTGGKHATNFYNILTKEQKKIVDEHVAELKRWQEQTQINQAKTKERQPLTDSAISLLAQYEDKPLPTKKDKSAYAEFEQAARENGLALSKFNTPEKIYENFKARYNLEQGVYDPLIRRKDIQGTTTPELVAKVFGGNTRGALREIAYSKTEGRFSEFDKLIAKRLLESKTLPNIEIVPAYKVKDGDGQYVSFTDTVQIVEGKVDSHTVLHEVTHGFLHNLILGFEKGEISNKSLRDLKKLYDTLLAEHPNLATDEDTEYGMSSLTEFASEMMSNPEFQLALSKIPYQRENVFTAFAKAVLELLGINPTDKATALASGLIAIDRALATGRGHQETRITGKIVNAPALLVKQAEEYKAGIETLDDWIKNIPEAAPPTPQKKVYESLTTVSGLKNLVRLFQNERYPIKNWEDMLERVKGVIHAGDKANNIATQITLGVGRAEDFFHTHIANPSGRLYDAIGDYAKARKLSVDSALKELQAIFIAMHEPERRRVKYLMTVPLTAEAADKRQKILELVRSNRVDEATAKELRNRLDELVRDNVPAEGAIGYTYDSTGMMVDQPVSAAMRDEQSIVYNVASGVDPKVFAEARALAAKSENAVYIKHIREALQEVHKATTDLNKRANYWSQPVSNIVAFYGFNDYVPLKGRPGEAESYADAMINYDSKINGKELQDVAYQFGGRLSESDNPLLQSLSDGVRAAMRAGRGGTDSEGKQFGLTFAIKNAIDQKLLAGAPVAHINFEDRYKFGEEMLKKKGENVFFHYNPDGSIDIYSIQDGNLREAIRRTYERTNPLVDALNKVTSTIGQFHTRYNVAFAPMNFVRDTLTNAFTIGAEMGPSKAAQYIGAVSAKVTQGGLPKAMKVARLYEKGEFKKIEELGKKDPYIQAMYEYIVEGGKVSYLSGLAIQSQFEKMQANIGKSGIARTNEQINGVIDLWTDMFELASRASGYQIIRDQYIQEGMDPKEAKVKATAYVKNLANFEQVGKWGRAAGAFFMFFRPSATGAVRAIEAIAPLFRSVDAAWDILPEAAKKLPNARQAFEESFYKQKRAAAQMSISLMGMGMVVYTMSLLMAGDDDEGRNEVATDDMSRWSRFARFHIPGTDIVFQIPWGFGLGSFAAAGAQIAAFFGGNNSVKDTFVNTMLVGMDSFLPLPVSRISPFDNPAAWAMDTATPSLFRPFFEYAMNLDGLGREIYNNRQSRVGDAYTGGDNIPELYKDAARLLAGATDGFLNWSPNTMYFFANNYADGMSRLIHNTYDLGLVAADQKAYNPKTGTIAFDSFFGAKSNYDARQFSSVENQIKEMERTLNMFKNDPEKFTDYVSKYPNEPAIVEIYNKSKGQLNKINQLANQYRVMPGLTPKERKELLDNLKQQQNLFKRNLIEVFQAYDIKP